MKELSLYSSQRPGWGEESVLSQSQAPQHEKKLKNPEGNSKEQIKIRSGKRNGQVRKGQEL